MFNIFKNKRKRKGELEFWELKNVYEVYKTHGDGHPNKLAAAEVITDCFPKLIYEIEHLRSMCELANGLLDTEKKSKLH
ncbi:hypothetical protein UFOVP1454_31 [uncultured Caudovirales phage]|uniref:Uncharacterized protein n=1 Tax=uncultured Caudovirales phage TaxID=2100421 RepID=A0A6J5SIT0_9CAUD|nr:hypothetical protein UFOVP1454_31 [uncultured Caudovirales phage]